MSAAGAERLDPRVQIELERLNTSTDEINRLEVELDEARLVFRQLLAESHLRIQQLTRKLGVSVSKARPYYEARFRANLASQELQAAAHAYEKANSAHSAAREMVYLAEQGLSRLTEGGAGAGVTLDPAWQEMLNHATARVNQAEAERAAAGATHRARAAHHRAAAALVLQLQHSLKRNIAKSRPYFEEKARINWSLDAQKSRVESLERGVCEAKLSYAQALRSLESISDEIHRHRSRAASLRDADTERVESNGRRDAAEASDDVSGGGEGERQGEAAGRERRDESVREWLQNQPASAAGEHAQVARPRTLPRELGGEGATPATGSRTPGDPDNWTEINLEYSSPEEISFDKCSNFSALENGRQSQVAYERLAGDGDCDGGSERTTPGEEEGVREARSPLGSEGRTSRVSACSPRRIIKPRAMSTAEGAGAEGVRRAGSARARLRPELPGWMRREERSPARRQSLDVILNDTGEKVKEIFSQGFTLFNMSSLTERRVSEPRAGAPAATSPPCSPARGAPPPPPRRMPSPLDKTLSYLNVYADSDDQGSDTDSLASVEMLTDEQIHSLMLDAQLEAVCSQLMSASVSAPPAAAQPAPAPAPAAPTAV